MERNYMRSWLVGMAVLFAGAAVARAQEPPPVRMNAENGPNADQTLQIDPTGPIQTGTVADAQFFRPPDLTQIGDYPDLHYGPWASYERLYWSLHQPSTNWIGDPGAAAAAGDANDLDTGFMKARFVWGNRFEIGYVNDDEYGWLTSILKTNTEFNTFNAATPTFIYFVNGATLSPTTGIPTSGEAGPLFSSVVASNTTRLTGIELMRTYRYPIAHDGGVWQFMYGVRFFQLHDRFDIEAETPSYSYTTATESYAQAAAPNSYDLAINNNIVGPQIGLQWDKECDRLTISSSIRAMFGANFQDATTWGFGGAGNETTNLVTGAVRFNGISGEPLHTFQSALDNVTFAPLGEFRLDASYKITSNVAIKCGYTAMLVSGIGRASNRIEYTAPVIGISNGGDKEHFFADGVTVGVEVNR